jgi:hypothetical protein
MTESSVPDNDDVEVDLVDLPVEVVEEDPVEDVGVEPEHAEESEDSVEDISGE